jgi:hypothetical protein
VAPLHLNDARLDDDTLPARHRSRRRSRRPSAPSSRAAFGVGLAVVCSVAAGQLLLSGPAATADTRSVAVADTLGVTGAQAPVTREAEELGNLVASRSERDADQATAAAAQTQAEQAATAAKAEAEARAAAEAAAAAQAAQAAEAAAAQAAAAAAERPSEAPAAPAPRRGGAAAPGTAATAVARINNSAGGVRPQTQAAADKVVSNVPGAGGITLGGTRASAADPGGHPSGLALDYMVMSNNALGEAIIAYHVAHWNELGVEYLIYKQRMLSSPGGSWVGMENRGSPTANHMDHVHVNYR